MAIPYPDTDQNGQDAQFDEEVASGADVGRSLWIIIPVIAVLFISVIYLALYSLTFQGSAAKNLLGRIGSFLFSYILPLLPFVILAFVLICLFEAARTFFNNVYLPPDSVDKTGVILHRLFGSASSVFIRGDKLDPKYDWVQWLGGPARLVVYDGFAVYIEQGYRFSRIGGPGITLLDSTETIKAIADLRPIVRPGVVKAWTKDGIRIQLNVRMECQILPEEKTQDSSAKLVYPFNETAVKKAIERTAVRYDHEKKALDESNWVDSVWGRAQSHLASYIFSHTVDELFLAEWGSSQIMSRDESIRMLQQLNKGLVDSGARILNLQITNITIPKEVEQQRVEMWRAGKESITTKSGGQAKAYEIRALEKAHAEAERDIIAAIAEGLERIDPARLQESLLLSLSGILDQSLSDPLTRTHITNETLVTLEKLKNLLQ